MEEGSVVESIGPDAREVRRLEEAGFDFKGSAAFPAGGGPISEAGRVLHRVLSDAVTAGVFPGAVSLVLKGRSVLFFRAFGKRMVTPEVEPMTCDTIFDMASLTKPLVTTTLVLQLVDEGVIRLVDPVRDFFPEFASNPLGNATVEQLLTHTAGFPEWRPVYLHARGREDALSFLARLEAVAQPGESMIYSDLGFMLLGFLAERLAGRTLEVVARERLFEPLRLQDSTMAGAADARRTAPTEDGNLFEQGMIGMDARNFGRWREGIIRNTVHDGNAFYVLDGVAGHAGLFSSAVDVAVFLRNLVGGSRETPLFKALGKRYVELVGLDRTSYLSGDHRGLGWVLNRGAGLLFGPSLNSRAFGHTGFTGTSVVVDPGPEDEASPGTGLEPGGAAIYILLSNRVHPSAHNTAVISFRGRFHEFASRLVAAEE